MHSATIPLAALATFAAVYWVTPGPLVVEEAEPARIAAAPASNLADSPRASAAPAARRARPSSGKAARPRRTVAATARAVRPVRRAPAVTVYFPGCNAVRAAGLAPLYRGEPGYRPEMDGDDDGIACEPYRGR
jgi:hypothetical protein